MTEYKRGDTITHAEHGEGMVMEVLSSGVECFFKRKGNEEGPMWSIFQPEELTEAPRPVTPLSEMVRKIDNRPAGHNGYIAYRDEVIAILQELSPRVPFNVFGSDGFGGDIHIEIKGGFTLERDLL